MGSLPIFRDNPSAIAIPWSTMFCDREKMLLPEFVSTAAEEPFRDPVRYDAITGKE